MRSEGTLAQLRNPIALTSWLDCIQEANYLGNGPPHTSSHSDRSNDFDQRPIFRHGRCRLNNLTDPSPLIPQNAYLRFGSNSSYGSTLRARARRSMLSSDGFRAKRSTCATNVLCKPDSNASSSCVRPFARRSRTRFSASTARARGGLVVWRAAREDIFSSLPLRRFYVSRLYVTISACTNGARSADGAEKLDDHLADVYDISCV